MGWRKRVREERVGGRREGSRDGGRKVGNVGWRRRRE